MPKQILQILRITSHIGNAPAITLIYSILRQSQIVRLNTYHPASVIFFHADCRDPLRSRALQASSTTSAVNPAETASIAVEATQKSVAKPD
jgi:hypothetical protein